MIRLRRLLPLTARWLSARPDLLRSHLVRALVLVVDPTEVGHDDGHGEGDDQHATQRADGAENLPGDGVGNHVAVTAERNVDMRNCGFKGGKCQVT